MLFLILIYDKTSGSYSNYSNSVEHQNVVMLCYDNSIHLLKCYSTLPIPRWIRIPIYQKKSSLLMAKQILIAFEIELMISEYLPCSSSHFCVPFLEICWLLLQIHTLSGVSSVFIFLSPKNRPALFIRLSHTIIPPIIPQFPTLPDGSKLLIHSSHLPTIFLEPKVVPLPLNSVRSKWMG